MCQRPQKNTFAIQNNLTAVRHEYNMDYYKNRTDQNVIIPQNWVIVDYKIAVLSYFFFNILKRIF